MTRVVRERLTPSFLVIAAAALVASPATSAKDGDVLVRGTCSGVSSSKLKLSRENAGIEVEFEVDQNRNGVRWTIVLSRPTRVLFRGTRVTRAPSGSVELRRVVANTTGPDRIQARATRSSGEVCRATATMG